MPRPASSAIRVPQHPHPLTVFGDVGEVEKDAERPGHTARLRCVERLDPGREPPLGVVVTGTTVTSEAPHLLDEREGFRARECADHLADRYACFLEHRSLFDMGLEIGGKRRMLDGGTAGYRASVTDAL